MFRATDTKLKRQVAFKILPPSLAADQDRLARVSGPMPRLHPAEQEIGRGSAPVVTQRLADVFWASP